MKTPYNTGKVKIGSNLPLPSQHRSLSRDELRIQKSFLPTPRQYHKRKESQALFLGAFLLSLCALCIGLFL